VEYKDLVFYKKVSGGRKSHYIFTQKNIFYVLTEQDEGIRGNFLAIAKSEVEHVKIQIIENRVPGNFNCNDIYERIQLGISLDRENPSYYVDRLTRVCYILYTQNFLTFHKEANKVIFERVRDPLIFSARTVQNKTVLTKSSSAITSCPHCKVIISKKNLGRHIRGKCPKLRGSLQNE
jgi:hypothetical protein